MFLLAGSNLLWVKMNEFLNDSKQSFSVKRYFIYFSYNGKNYHGWQIQPNGITVQQQIQHNLSILLSKSISIVGAGRTDAGVHARLMTAHFDWKDLLQTYCLTTRLNKMLPYDISVEKILPVKTDAHARFDVVSRTYTYVIGYEKNPFRHGQFYLSKHWLDTKRMNEAAAILLEYTDFTSFCKLHSDTKNHFCRISKAKWNIIDNMVVFTIQSDRFLRNMVRSIVGTLIDIGRNKLSIKTFREIIESKNRANAGISVPAHGLFLTDIEYPSQIFEVCKH